MLHILGQVQLALAQELVRLVNDFKQFNLGQLGLPLAVLVFNPGFHRKLLLEVGSLRFGYELHVCLYELGAADPVD